MTTELIVIEQRNALEVFTSQNGLDPMLAKIRELIDSHKPDVSTKKGRDEIKSLAHSIAKSKAYLDGIGKELTDKLKEQPKLVDAERKRMRDLLDAWKDEVREPVTKLEEAEKAFCSHMAALRLTEFLPSAEIEKRLNEAQATETDFAVCDPKAVENAKDITVKFLTAELAKVVEAERQQAELERLRKEQAEREQKDREERIAREAAERARIEAEQKAKAEQERVEREKREAIEAAERAERMRIEAQQKAERDAKEAAERAEREKQAAIEYEQRMAQQRENARIAAEQEQKRQAELAEKARLANVEHRRNINNQCLAALIEGGIDEETAKKVITLAAKGEAAWLVINY